MRIVTNHDAATPRNRGNFDEMILAVGLDLLRWSAETALFSALYGIFVAV
jgi:hypothetical protein